MTGKRIRVLGLILASGGTLLGSSCSSSQIYDTIALALGIVDIWV